MFIDNSNFAEQGAPITKYFREDKLYLSNRGSLDFGNNLKQELNHILNQSGHENKIHETDLSERDTSTTTGVMRTEIISVLVHGTGEPTILIDEPRRNRDMADTLCITKTIIQSKL